MDRVTNMSITSPQIEQSQPVGDIRSLEMDLGKLLKSGFLSDITFRASEVKFRAHRAILAARSSYFRAMFASQMREAATADSEIDVPDVEPRLFELVLRYLYTSSLDLTQDGLDLLRLLELCKFYFLEELLTQVTQFLVENLDLENVIPLFDGAMVLESEILKFACLDFIVRLNNQISDILYLCNTQELWRNM